MKQFELFITYMSWDGGGKDRPVLVFMTGDSIVDVFKITTKYENKSATIRALYFKLDDWAEAGLHTQSYIDTGTLITLPVTIFQNKKSIGTLTENDKRRLLKFLED